MLTKTVNYDTGWQLQVLLVENHRTDFEKTGMCLLKSSTMSIKVLSFLHSSVMLKHAWTIQCKWRSSCQVPGPQYSAQPKRFESRGPIENVFCARSRRIRHRSELTESAWENAVQGLVPHLYMMKHLKVIMNVSWKDKITNKERLCLAGLLSMADILIEKNLRRLGHVHRMDNNRLPKKLLAATKYAAVNSAW